MSRVTKAIIAAAGLGTRFLPVTKVIQKEMLPIVDKPGIQYPVEEVVASGIEDIAIVVRPGSFQIKNHFSPAPELEKFLLEVGKTQLREEVAKLSKFARITFFEQTPDLPYGTGSALLAAKNFIQGDEPFAFLFGDDLVKSNLPGVKQTLDLWESNQDAIVLGAQEVPLEEVFKYGIVRLKEGSEYEIDTVVEKPSVAEAPSRLALFGRYILNGRIFKILEEKEIGKGGELWLTDAIAKYIKDGNRALVGKIDGKWMTTGDPLHLLQAGIEYALDRGDIGEKLREYLEEKIKD